MYNIFHNDFFDNKPTPTFAFTVEFFFNVDHFDVIENKEDDQRNALERWLIENTHTQNWSDMLSKAVSKLSIVHPDSQEFNLFYPGYYRTELGRYGTAGDLQVTFNDNIRRDIRFRLEQLMYASGMKYGEEADNTYPVFPDKLRFDMLVRIYDIYYASQYWSTDIPDGVREQATRGAFWYKDCFVSKISPEQNSYDGSGDTVRTVEATITYHEMIPE